MTPSREDIIRMAREAGFHAWYTQPEEHPDHVAIIERFAALVAAAERERIKAANAPEIEKINAYIKSLEEAAAQIRARGTHDNKTKQ